MGGRMSLFGAGGAGGAAPGPQEQAAGAVERGAMVAEVEEVTVHGPGPISERRVWADVTPRRPPPQAQPVIAIGRDPQHGELMDYFWAAVAAGELSGRVLALTKEIILHLNSSNYSVWEWRWRCLEALGGPVAHAAEERALMRAVAARNPKNYQLWNARRRLALALGPECAEEELEFAAACLAVDAKNYHAWAHRQAVLAAGAPLRLWAAELAFTERLLRDDLRNNSAWSQRRCVLGAAPAGALGPAAETYSSEVDWVRGQLRLALHNEAAWAYLRGLCGAAGAPPAALATEPRLLAACRDALAAHPSCVPALVLLADVHAAQAVLLEGAAAGAAPGDGARLRAAAARARGDAGEVLSKLQVADPLRASLYRLQAAAVGGGSGSA
eukprot:scaffold2.g7361.t1